MSDERPDQRRYLYPGLGLVIGAGLGMVVGLLLFPEVFFLGIPGGAGLGLIAGAAAHSSSR